MSTQLFTQSSLLSSQLEFTNKSIEEVLSSNLPISTQRKVKTPIEEEEPRIYRCMMQQKILEHRQELRKVNPSTEKYLAIHRNIRGLQKILSEFEERLVKYYPRLTDTVSSKTLSSDDDARINKWIESNKVLPIGKFAKFSYVEVVQCDEGREYLIQNRNVFSELDTFLSNFRMGDLKNVEISRKEYCA